MDEHKRFKAWKYHGGPDGDLLLDCYLAADYDALRAERDALQTARDQALQDCVDMKHIKDKVAAFMETWHQRAKDAEAERDTLRSRLAVLTVAADALVKGATLTNFATYGVSWIDPAKAEALRSALGDVGDVRERVAIAYCAAGWSCSMEEAEESWRIFGDTTKELYRKRADRLLAAMLPKEVR